MGLSVANAARAKPRYSDGSLANEEVWVGHAADHDTIGGTSLGVFGVTWVIGAEAGDIINVGIVLDDQAGLAIAEVGVVTAFLSDAVTGIGITATAPDTAVAIGTDGVVLAVVTTDKIFLVQSDAAGAIDFDLDETSTGTWYMVVILENGTMAVSPAITFA